MYKYTHEICIFISFFLKQTKAVRKYIWCSYLQQNINFKLSQLKRVKFDKFQLISNYKYYKNIVFHSRLNGARSKQKIINKFSKQITLKTVYAVTLVAHVDTTRLVQMNSMEFAVLTSLFVLIKMNKAKSKPIRPIAKPFVICLGKRSYIMYRS